MIKRSAEDGNVLLPLDALDELPRPTYNAHVESLRRWTLAYPAAYCFATSRLLDAPLIPEFQGYEFAPFLEADIAEFVRKHLSKEDAERFLAAVVKVGTQSLLLTSPLLLWHFVQEIANGRPAKPGVLYVRGPSSTACRKGSTPTSALP